MRAWLRRRFCFCVTRKWAWVTSTIPEWTGMICLNAVDFQSTMTSAKFGWRTCRVIKSLDITLMKNAESRPQRPVNAGTSSRSALSNNFKFGDPLQPAKPCPARGKSPSQRTYHYSVWQYTRSWGPKRHPECSDYVLLFRGRRRLVTVRQENVCWRDSG